jgi:hypothetical protein
MGQRKLVTEMPTRNLIVGLLLTSLLVAIPAAAAEPSRPATRPLKTLNDHFPFHVPDTVDAWEQRARDLRRRVQVATGLWPMPEKSPLHPVIFGKIQRDGFTVEKVYFESLPGHFVTGMLFRPAADNPLARVNGKRPGVLCPHGHGGRTMRLSDQELAKQLESGSEVHAESGRFPKLARCAHLARMGCVSFIFDMVGYADSQQIDYRVAHRHADPRPEEANRQQPCFFSIDADLNLQSIMGLQTWNGIRALDFLAGLPDVDQARLGCTGGSGGGTQTILLGALDPRLRVAFPNGMVSTSMQGGCYCENCNYLRIGTGNVELAALFAPKPQGMTAANDWTKAMLEDGFPELKRLYAMLGVPENVICGDLLRFPHNYNYVTRAIMYRWMAKHLELPQETPLVEADFPGFSENELKIWDEEHPAPSETGVAHERRVLAWWKRQSDRKLRAAIPAASATDEPAERDVQAYRRLVGGAWRVLFDRRLPQPSELGIDRRSRPADSGSITEVTIRHPEWQVRVDARVVEPAGEAATRTIVIADSGSTSDPPGSLSLPDGLNATSARLVHLQWQELDGDQPTVDDDRDYAAFTFAYNRPWIVKRFEQLLCVIAATKAEYGGELVLYGSGPIGASAAAAASVIARDTVDRSVIDTQGFRFRQVEDQGDARFVPGAAKYFDLPGLLSLRAPAPLTVLSESESSLEVVQRLYAASDAERNLELR